MPRTGHFGFLARDGFIPLAMYGKKFALVDLGARTPPLRPPPSQVEDIQKQTRQKSPPAEISRRKFDDVD